MSEPHHVSFEPLHGVQRGVHTLLGDHVREDALAGVTFGYEDLDDILLPRCESQTFTAIQVVEPQLRHRIAIRSAGFVWTTSGLPIHTMGAPASLRKVVDSVGLVLLRCGVPGMAQHSLGGVFFLDIHQVFSDL